MNRRQVASEGAGIFPSPGHRKKRPQVGEELSLLPLLLMVSSGGSRGSLLLLSSPRPGDKRSGRCKVSVM